MKLPPVPVPFGVVTLAVTAPAACAPVVHLRLVAVIEFMDVQATPPILAAVAPVRLVPVMVIWVPPPVGPLFGEIEEIVGAGFW